MSKKSFFLFLLLLSCVLVFLSACSTANTAHSSPTPSNSTIKTQYSLGTAVSKSCEKGEAIISLDDVKLVGTTIQLTASNQGEVFFPNNHSCWEICFYDSEGYLLQGDSLWGANCNADPFKPGETVTNFTIDYSHSKYFEDIEYFSVDYFVFDSNDDETLNERLYFNYAFDKESNQIDYYSLKR